MTLLFKGSRALTPPSSPTNPVATRQQVLHALDRWVRPLLRTRLLGDMNGCSPVPPVLDLTVYEVVYAHTPAVGGFWTVATCRPSGIGHQVAAFTVIPEFDACQQPVRYTISGAADIASDDATPEALDRALVHAAAGGPHTTWAPTCVPGISL